MSPLTEQQLKAVESIDSNVLVSAGAGSGKTHVLVERFLEILKRDPQLRVSQIVAVTYTNKAAREMRMRLKSRMEDMVGEASVETRQRFAECRAEIDGGRIGTIHSLCDSLLKNFPAEAEVDPKFEILDELDAAELLLKSIDKSMMSFEGSEEHELLMNHPVEQVRSWLSTTIKSKLEFDNSVGTLPGLDDSQLSRHCLELLSSIQGSAIEELVGLEVWTRSFSYLTNCKLSDPGNKLNEVVRQVLGLMQSLSEVRAKVESRQPEELKSAVLNLAVFHSAIDLRVGGQKEDAKALKAVLKELRQCIDSYAEYLPAQMSEYDSHAFKRIRALISFRERALRFYAQGKKDLQKMDFNDLIVNAYKLLLKPDSSARRFYNESLAAILVDEFQDTNPMQARLIAALAGKQTRLFLIGDDKQSIYKFQGADVSVFNEWKAHFGSGGGAIEISGQRHCQVLNTSFRSHPGIVNFVNLLFARLFGTGNGGRQHRASHQPLIPDRSDKAHDCRVDVVFFNGETAVEEESSVQLEARAVCRWIEEKIADQAVVLDRGQGGQRPINYGDFAILVQRNSDFLPIEYALEEMEMPYVTMGGAGFLQRQEVLDLENLLKFLWAPADNQALLGALRSPMFGLSDDMIQAFAGKKNLWTALKEEAKCEQHLAGVVEILNCLIEEGHEKPLPDLLASIIKTTAYDTVLLFLPNGRQRSRNLWKLLKMANDSSHLSIGDFIKRLQSMRQLRVKQSAAPVDSGDAIKLMTIHSAKGLEFSAVICPVMNVEAYQFRGKLVFHRQYGVAFDTSRGQGDDCKPSLFKIANYLEKDMAIAEKKRLFYVALTRARDYLALFVNRQKIPSSSFADWLCSGLNIDPMAPLNGEQSGIIEVKGDGGDALYRLVSDSQPDGIPAKQSRATDGRSVLHAYVPGRQDLLDSRTVNLPLPAVPREQLLRVTPAPSRKLLAATVVGNYFHLLMEHLTPTLQPLSRQAMDNIACMEGVNVIHKQLREALVAEGKRLLELFFGSSLHELMKRAQLRLHEVPYLKLDAGHSLQSRRPDLLLLDEKRQWHLIDYKTDHFERSELTRQAGRHHAQLKGYVDDLQMVAGIKAQPAIYFAQQAILCSLDEGDTGVTESS